MSLTLNDLKLQIPVNTNHVSPLLLRALKQSKALQIRAALYSEFIFILSLSILLNFHQVHTCLECLFSVSEPMSDERRAVTLACSSLRRPVTQGRTGEGSPSGPCTLDCFTNEKTEAPQKGEVTFQGGTADTDARLAFQRLASWHSITPPRWSPHRDHRPPKTR